MRKTASVESVKLTPPTLEKELEFIELLVHVTLHEGGRIGGLSTGTTGVLALLGFGVGLCTCQEHGLRGRVVLRLTHPGS